MTLGEQVQSRRRDLGLLQIDLAEMGGVSERFVRELEHDKPTLRLDKIVAVLDVLGLELHTRLRETTT